MHFKIGTAWVAAAIKILYENCSYNFSYQIQGFLGPRCDLPEVLRATGCPDEHVYVRGSSELRLKQDEVFSDFGREDDGHAAVQVRPQSALVRLRAGDVMDQQRVMLQIVVEIM